MFCNIKSQLSYFILPVFDGKGAEVIFPSALPSSGVTAVRQSLWCPDGNVGGGGGNGGGGGGGMCIKSFLVIQPNV